MSTREAVFAALQRFMETVDRRLTKYGDETRSLLIEARSALAELQTRAAASVPPGKDGRDGIDGKDGRDGKDGARGENGARGADGLTGANGKDGRDGVDGATGDKGEAGPAGNNGERGAQGERGADGLQGRDGAAGLDGAPGAIGPQGERGVQGERGADGLHGRDGAAGPQGERGADGIATRAELDALIEARFAELQVRSLADSWRGVWSPTETYQRGNVAQWDGSPWLALAVNPATKPGTSTEWVLFAKKGRDGSRDGRK